MIFHNVGVVEGQERISWLLEVLQSGRVQTSSWIWNVEVEGIPWTKELVDGCAGAGTWVDFGVGGKNGEGGGVGVTLLGLGMPLGGIARYWSWMDWICKTFGMAATWGGFGWARKSNWIW